MSPVRVGVLGAAKIANRSMVPALLATDGIHVAGVAARDANRAIEFGRTHGIAAYPDYTSIVEASDIDAVYIPLPVGLHARWALAALESGKHVLVEKSLAGNLGDCLRVLDTASRLGLVVLENFMCERHPQGEWVRHAVSSGALGDVHHASLSFGFPPFPAEDLRNSLELEGGALNDAGAYCVDMAAFYLGRWPTAVTASLERHDMDVDTVGAAFLEFGGGLTASISFGFEHDYRNEARVWGRTGQVDIDRSFSIPADRIPQVTVTRNTEVTRIDLEPADQFALQAAYFRDLIEGESSAAEESVRRRRHAITMDAIRRSAATGQRIVIPADEGTR